MKRPRRILPISSLWRAPGPDRASTMTAVDPRRERLGSPLLALRPRRVEAGILALVGVVIAVAYVLAGFGTTDANAVDLGPFRCGCSDSGLARTS